MRISERQHTFESFINELVTSGVEPGDRLRVVCYFSSEAEWDRATLVHPSIIELFGSNNVEVGNLGEIKKLVTHYKDSVTSNTITVTYFAYLHRDTRLLMCFTKATKIDVEQTLDKIVERNPGLYYAFIGPSTLNKVQSLILETHPGAFISYFTARRNRKAALKSEVRPEYERTIQYRGKDGKESLEELKYAYGVAPRSIHFEIPGFAEYHISSVGHLAIAKGNENARRYLLELTDFTMKDSMVARRIIESADFQLIPIETQRKTMLFPKLKPWLIKFGSPIDIKDGENLIEILQNSNFDVFNHVLAQGSLRLNGMISDRSKNAIFTIDANSERMVIAPLQDLPFDSFLRFYQIIVENFDPKAECEVFE
jgi:hypothetical protein